MEYIDIEFNELDGILTYYVDSEDSEQQTIECSKIEIVVSLGYETKVKHGDLYFSDGSVIDKFNGEHYQEECWELVSEWNPSDEELTNFINYKTK